MKPETNHLNSQLAFHFSTHTSKIPKILIHFKIAHFPYSRNDQLLLRHSATNYALTVSGSAHSAPSNRGLFTADDTG